MARRRKSSKKRLQLNIGLITFAVILIYLFSKIAIYCTKDKLSLYEVQQDKIVNRISTVGIAVRDEQIVSSDKAGYVNFYIREGAKANKNSVVYTLDETGNINDMISEYSTETESISNENIKELRSLIGSFHNYYNDSQFHQVYDFKYDLNNTILEQLNHNVMENLDQVLKDSNVASTFQKYRTSISGIVTYVTDGYESFTIDNIKKSDFTPKNYKRNQVKSGSLVKSGEPIYKLITGNDWNIVIMLSKEQFDFLSEKNTVKLKFQKDNQEETANVTTFQNGSNYYAKLTLSNLMYRYMNDRFIDVELTLQSAEGLKIPTSSITEKEFYKVPIDYLSASYKSQKKTAINVQKLGKNSEIEVEQMFPTIYEETDEYFYIDPNEIKGGTILVKENSSDTFTIGNTEKLEGVYCVNQGYATFKPIQKLYANDDFCIINGNTTGGIVLYDYIVLNHKSIKENEIIY